MRTHVGAAAIAGAAAAGAAAAQDGPELRSYHDHWFLSAATDDVGGTRLFHQACNRGDGGSAFRWHGAGFGVRAYAELAPDHCAIKNTYGVDGASPKAHAVRFQGGGRADVVTWSRDAGGGVAGFVWSTLDVMVRDPDGAVALSAISIGVTVRPEDGAVTLRIGASGAFDEVVVALPDGGEGVLDRLDLVAGSVDRTALTLGEAAPADEVGLVGDPDAPALRLAPEEPGPFSAVFAAGPVEEVGFDRADLYGLVAGEVVAASAVAMPWAEGDDP